MNLGMGIFAAAQAVRDLDQSFNLPALHAVFDGLIAVPAKPTLIPAEFRMLMLAELMPAKLAKGVPAELRDG